MLRARAIKNPLLLLGLSSGIIGISSSDLNMKTYLVESVMWNGKYYPGGQMQEVPNDLAAALQVVEPTETVEVGDVTPVLEKEHGEVADLTPVLEETEPHNTKESANKQRSTKKPETRTEV